jgi:hypothetical protein
LNQTWSRQVQHTWCFHPKVLNQKWRTENFVWFKTFGLNHPVCSVFHVWFKTIGLNHPVCLICQFFMSGSKLLYWIILHTGWFNTKVWTRHEVLTSWTYRVIHSKSFEPDMMYWQVEHKGWFHPNVLNQTWSTDKLNMQGDSIICQYFMSGSNFCIESSCMFNLSVFNVWYKTFGWNHSVCSTCLFFMSDSKLLDWILTSWIYRVIPSKLNVLVLNIAEQLLAGC